MRERRNTMSIAQSMLPEFDNEMANTRKMLERVPDDKLSYKPDPKSMTLGRLASHVAEIVGWGVSVFNDDSYVITPDHKPFDAKSRLDLLETFEKDAKQARAALADAPDSGMMDTWALKFGDQVLLSMPRAAVYRSMIMNHIIHHRAQLSVYFRLVGVPVPGMYGPSADEK
jgi:uncharacterized damage-inducible protein DinB